jgi:GntR family transcriptional repressor for pyruvate dehydrogenase complex
LAIQGRLQAVRKVRVYEEIVSQITSLILNGELKYGDKLPPERELCERFGVGRNSVREATRALESANLVETRQGEGTFVTVSPDSLVPALSAKISSEGESGFHLLFEARRILEPQIAALATKRAAPAELKELSDILERQKKEVQAGRSGIDEDTEFHMALAKAAKNEFLLRLVGILLEPSRVSS